jgi:hypothetical protein
LGGSGDLVDFVFAINEVRERAQTEMNVTPNLSKVEEGGYL